MIELQFKDVKPLDLSYLSKWYLLVCEKEGKKLGDMGVVIGTDDWLLEKNIKYLNHDFYTDVITFDYCEGNLISGDLLVSWDRIVDNAHKLNLAPEVELSRVLVHGLLHLCGYDDQTKEEEEIIRSKEDFYLNLL